MRKNVLKKYYKFVRTETLVLSLNKMQNEALEFQVNIK